MKKLNQPLSQDVADIEYRICLIRTMKTMLADDLARIYKVKPSALIQAVSRNRDRFPEDFCFQLTDAEVETLKSQSVISKSGRGGRRHNPYAFTEHGVVMLSAVLRSERAVAMSIYIARAFVKLREMSTTKTEFILKLEELKREQEMQGELLDEVCKTVNVLTNEPVKPIGPIGFKPKV